MAGEKGFYMQRQTDGSYQLDPKSEYFHQVQVCLHVLERPACEFVVAAEKDLYVQRIAYDAAFVANMLPKLEEFFVRFLLPVHADQPILQSDTYTYTAVSRAVWIDRFGGTDYSTVKPNKKSKPKSTKPNL